MKAISVRELGRLACALGAAGLLMMGAGGCATTKREVIARAGKPYPMAVQLIEPAKRGANLRLTLTELPIPQDRSREADPSLKALRIEPPSIPRASVSNSFPVIPPGGDSVAFTFNPPSNANGKNFVIVVWVKGPTGVWMVAGAASVVVGPPTGPKPSEPAPSGPGKIETRSSTTTPYVKTPIGVGPR